MDKKAVAEQAWLASIDEDLATVNVSSMHMLVIHGIGGQ
jgi:hypothetical protein